MDDVTTDIASWFKRRSQSLVVETSPNRCHAWLSTSTSLNEEQRRIVQVWLANKQLQQHRIGDTGSTSGEHFGRLAGFRNQKPERDCWVNLLYAEKSEHRLDAEAILKNAFKGGSQFNAQQSVGNPKRAQGLKASAADLDASRQE